MIMKKSPSSEFLHRHPGQKLCAGLFRNSKFYVCDVKALVLYRHETETKKNKSKLSIIDFDMYIHNFSQRNKLRVWPSRPKVKVVVEVHLFHIISLGL